MKYINQIIEWLEDQNVAGGLYALLSVFSFLFINSYIGVGFLFIVAEKNKSALWEFIKKKYTDITTIILILIFSGSLYSQMPTGDPIFYEDYSTEVASIDSVKIDSSFNRVDFFFDDTIRNQYNQVFESDTSYEKLANSVFYSKLDKYYIRVFDKKIVVNKDLN